jgi:hypothetical protein
MKFEKRKKGFFCCSGVVLPFVFEIGGEGRKKRQKIISPEPHFHLNEIDFLFVFDIFSNLNPFFVLFGCCFVMKWMGMMGRWGVELGVNVGGMLK